MPDDPRQQRLQFQVRCNKDEEKVWVIQVEHTRDLVESALRILCKGHTIIVIKYLKILLFIFPESSNTCGQ